MEKTLIQTREKPLKQYLMLTKPGIIMGNVVNAIGGFSLASKGHFSFSLFLAMLVGMACVIGSACTFNNYIDREADRKMTRTRNRPLARGTLSVRSAMLFGTFLGLVGITILALYTNPLTAGVALFGFTVYVALYSFTKYRTVYGTLIGSFAGAVPPVIGYCAITNRFDSAALILFLMITLWQMPHFFAIALYRMKDYAAASIPVMPLKRSPLETKVHILLYIIAFMVASSLLTLFHYTNYLFLILVALSSLVWFVIGIRGLNRQTDARYGRTMFILSLVVVMTLSLTLPFTVV